jgi:predicted AlkP superfamily pyrophosphatase or phosphodiesterase
MKQTAVLNVVGLTRRHIGEHTPFIQKWMSDKQFQTINPVLPAVTCSAQSTYLTGKWPAEHGIVANGWYFKTEKEIKFWRQSNDLVQSPKIWDVAQARNAEFTCANLFWWYNMYSSVDYSVTPRPNYLANGLKIPDVYSQPADLRDELQAELGQFPLFKFWGPKTSIESSAWIANSAIYTYQKYRPTLTLIYLPHLDYNLQRHGPDHPSVSSDLQEIDREVEKLISYFEGAGCRVIVLSEYGITPVHRPIHLNRILREEGLLAIRREQSWELLDAGASRAFAVADHQIAHVYVRDHQDLPRVRAALSDVPGIEFLLDKEAQEKFQIHHERAGDLVAVADRNSWFTYYYWLEDDKAPDFARTVDIHRKPGFDPVEMFVDPKFTSPLLAAGWRLMKKKLGFRYLMDLIPLDARLVKGSHGRIPEDPLDHPVFISSGEDKGETLSPVDVQGRLLDAMGL